MEWVAILRYAAPVALSAIGETVNQRAGTLNIGIEGQMLTSAFVGAMVSLDTGNPWTGLLAGLATGLLFALLLAPFVFRWAADQVVVGTAANLLALGLTGTLYRVRFGQSGQLLNVPALPRLAGDFDIVLLFLILATAITGWALVRTRWGLALRAAGHYPAAAEAAGFSVPRLRLGAWLFGGAMAGLAGSYLSVGIAASFAENMTAGRGFVAIAVVTFGRWRPGWVLGAALFIGFAEGLQYRFQSLGLQAPYQLFIALPYLAALAVLVIAGRASNGPGALGQPFRPDR